MNTLMLLVLVLQVWLRLFECNIPENDENEQGKHRQVEKALDLDRRRLLVPEALPVPYLSDAGKVWQLLRILVGTK